MRQRSKNSAIILVPRGLRLPRLPEQVRDYITMEKVHNVYDGPSLPFKEYDEYLIRKASAGFSPKGSIRLIIKDSKYAITWISGRDVRGVYAIQNGRPKPSINRMLCPFCNHLTGYRIKKHDLPQKPAIDSIDYHCSNCKNDYSFKCAAKRPPKQKPIVDKERHYRVPPRKKRKHHPA